MEEDEDKADLDDWEHDILDDASNWDIREDDKEDSDEDEE